MRTADELEERLRLLTQALHFSHAHRNELSPEALARHRVVEENIALLSWCLEPADPSRLSWSAAGRALKQALGLVFLKLKHPATVHGLGQARHPGPEAR